MTKKGRYEKSDVFPFGEYREEGRTISWMLIHNPKYVLWAVNKIQWFRLSHEAQESFDRVKAEL